jgi:cytochrome c556
VRKHVVPIVAALAVVGVFAEVVYAQSADRAIRYRQGIMRAQGWHLGMLGAMAKGERPYDKEVAARSARFVATLNEMPWEGFGPGTESGAPTKAKPDIWKNKAKFDQYAQESQVKTKELAAAAGTDLATMRTALGATAKACDACHDDFREK